MQVSLLRAPAAHPKRLAIWTQWLDTTLLAPVPHRQVVLTIPKRLRAYCRIRRRLLGEIARVAARTVTAAIRTLTGERALTRAVRRAFVRLALFDEDQAAGMLMCLHSSF